MARRLWRSRPFTRLPVWPRSLGFAQVMFSKPFAKELRDLIRSLLQADTTKRFGCLRNGVMDIKEHKWFREINWVKIYQKAVVPDFVPVLKVCSRGFTMV